MANNLPNLYHPATMPGLDPRTERIVMDLFDRVNYLTTELDRVRGLANSASPGVNAAKKENPTKGIVTILSPGGDGFIRLNEDGVIADYASPIKDTFPYADNSTKGNDTGVGLTNLHTFALQPAILANNGDYLRVKYSGTFAANANSKRIQIVFGSLVISNIALVQNVAGWVYDIHYLRTLPTNIYATGIFIWNFATPVGGFINSAFGSITVSGTVTNMNTGVNTLAVQADGGANNDVVQNLSIIERYKIATWKPT